MALAEDVCLSLAEERVNVDSTHSSHILLSKQTVVRGRDLDAYNMFIVVKHGGKCVIVSQPFIIFVRFISLSLSQMSVACSTQTVLWFS